jgi:hypothetical protein
VSRPCCCQPEAAGVDAIDVVAYSRSKKYIGAPPRIREHYGKRGDGDSGGATGMTTRQNSVIRHLRRAAFLLDAGNMTDGQLLQRFLGAREEAAFEVLLRRARKLPIGQSSSPR